MEDKTIEGSWEWALGVKMARKELVTILPWPEEVNKQTKKTCEEPGKKFQREGPSKGPQDRKLFVRLDN
jgi:hypothetical protein